jgi:hypothetical protein
MFYYFYSLACFLIFYFSGHILCSILSIIIDSLYKRIFTKTFIGLVFIILVYSIIRSSGMTINIVIIPLVLFIFLSGDYKFRLAPVRNIISITEDKKALFPSILLLSILFACQYWLIIYTKTGYPAILNSDDLFNSHAAMYINYTGKETLNWNYIHPTNNEGSPYHYFICWIISFLSMLFRQNPYLANELSVNPLFYFLTIIGLWAFAEKYSVSAFIKIFCVFILFMCGLHLSIMDKYPLFNWSYFYFNIFEPDAKLSLYYIVIIASILLLQYTKYTTALLVFLLLPIFSIVLAPSVFIIASVLIFLNALTTRGQNIKAIVYPVIIAACILLFYKIFNRAQMLGIPALSLHTGTLFSFAFKTFVYKSAVALLVYCPYLLAIIYSFIYINPSNRKIVRLALCFIALCFIVSFSIWMALFNYYGAIEFHYYFITPIMHVLLFMLLLYSYLHLQTKSHRIIFLVLAMPALILSAMHSLANNNQAKMIYQGKYSTAYLNTVKEEVKNENPLLVVSTHHDGISAYSGNPFTPSIATYLSTMTNYSSLMRLYTNNDSLHKEVDRNRQTMSEFNPFTMFVVEQKNSGSYKNLEQSRVDFVKANHIKYLIVAPNLAPDSALAPYITKQITDSISGESFVELKF